jgi:hypothetical protein
MKQNGANLNSFLLHVLLSPQALKKEIAQLKQGSGGGALAVSSTSASSLVDGSKEEIAAKLIAYQQFMAKYIVDSHQQKVLAVKAAEAAVVKRYEEKIQFLLAPPAAATASVLAPPPASAENTSYAARSAKVTAAAKAGKSRWGDLENAKAAGAPVTAPPVVKAVTASSSAAPVKQTITNIGASIVNGVIPEVEAADHGLRADGGVGGFTLAERVTLGADVVKVNGATANGATAPIAMASSTVAPAYVLRNAKIAAAAKAGKSRWGPLEIQRAQSTASLPLSSRAASVPVPPEVLAADHGLRADGGVGGPTLAERVNLGARLLGN